MVALWALSVRLRDVGIVDTFWGPAFLVIGGTIAWVQGGASARGVVVLLLVGLWAARLATHLYIRARGEPEDRRYAAMRERRGEAFAAQSLYVVFGLQAALAFVISAPIQLTLMAEPTALGWLDLVAGAVVLAGIAIEALADLQLTRFKSDPENKGRVLRSGLFRYSRHPNYFGNFCIFWGLQLFALGVEGGAWAAVGPALLTVLLLRVSGVTMLERDIAERRPGYRQYVRTTPAFFPWFPRSHDAG
jgi:steroid 5-alpha reductase family enzyme